MKIIKSVTKKAVTIQIIRNSKFDYILVGKLFGFQIIEINLSDVFDVIREKIK